MIEAAEEAIFGDTSLLETGTALEHHDLGLEYFLDLLAGAQVYFQVLLFFDDVQKLLDLSIRSLPRLLLWPELAVWEPLSKLTVKLSLDRLFVLWIWLISLAYAFYESAHCIYFC